MLWIPDMSLLKGSPEWLSKHTQIFHAIRFFFRNASRLEVLADAKSIKSNAIDLDGIPLRFSKLTLPMYFTFSYS